MWGIVRNRLFVPIMALALAAGANAPALAQTIAATEKPAAKPARVSQSGAGHVYLLRGLLNIFSLGMDDLAAKIQARGISATVHNHSEWQTLADEIAAKHKAGRQGPIVLVGHSLGADAVMFMGEYLGKKGVPVALIVPFDGTGSFAASSNVARVMNLTQRDYAHMRRGAGFRGELANIDVTSHGVGHIDIDKSARLHAMVITKIQGVVGRGSRTAGEGRSPAPRVRPASDAPSDPAEPAPTGTLKPSAAPGETRPAPLAPRAPMPGTTASTSGASVERGLPSSPAEASVERPRPDTDRPALRF